ncbi:MAG: hypothetical protein V1797_03315 [Pseudomonadota bacterium]
MSRYLPRVLLGLFILSLILPLPRYLAGMDSGEKLIWLSQLAWVAGLAGLILAAAGLGAWLWRRRGGR